MAKASNVQVGPWKNTESAKPQELFLESDSSEVEVTDAASSTPRSKMTSLDDTGNQSEHGTIRRAIAGIGWLLRGATPSSRIQQAELEGGLDDEEQTQELEKVLAPHKESQPLLPASVPSTRTPGQTSDVHYPQLQVQEYVPLHARGSLGAQREAVSSKDVYDVELSPEQTRKRPREDDMIPITSLKRQRVATKAKKPLVPPRRSRGTLGPPSARHEVDRLMQLSEDAKSDKEMLGGTASHPPAPMDRLAQPQEKDSEHHDRPRSNPVRQESEKQANSEVADPGLFVTDDEDSVERDGEEAEEEKEEVTPPASLTIGQVQKSLIDIKILDEMLRTARFYGRRKWKDAYKETPLSTEESKRLEKRFKYWLKVYDSLAMAKSNRNKDQVRAREAQIDNLISKTARELENMSGGLPTVATDTSDANAPEPRHVRKLLRDIFFHTVPRLMELIKKCAETYIIEGSMETSALQNFTQLVTLLHNLCHRSSAAPQEYQPTSPYGASQPAKNLAATTRKYQAELQRELKARNRADLEAEAERMRSRRERERIEQQALEDRVRRQRVMDRRRLQSKAFKEQVEDPVFGHIMLTQMLEDSEKVNPGRLPPQLIRYFERTTSQESQRSDAEDDPFTSMEADVDPRITVNDHFGKNNVRGNHRSMVLSRQQMKDFVSVLRRNRGPDRYEIAAKVLQLSMDEVFYHAKDFQEAMDKKHGEGMFNHKEDDWTYDVWIEKR